MANDDQLAHRTSDEAHAATLIVPLGATEQHGPHLPLGTDTMLAQAWCERLARGRPDVVVAPALPYGSSGEHQSFPGTLSIGQDVLRLLLVELVRSASHTYAHVVLVSGHAGNLEPLTAAVSQLREEGHCVDFLLPVLAGSDAHAGRTETSLMLHIAPEFVRPDLAEAGCVRPISEIIEALRSGGVAAVSDNGVLGDPNGATATEGAQLAAQLDAMWPMS